MHSSPWPLIMPLHKEEDRALGMCTHWLRPAPARQGGGSGLATAPLYRVRTRVGAGAAAATGGPQGHGHHVCWLQYAQG